MKLLKELYNLGKESVFEALDIEAIRARAAAYDAEQRKAAAAKATPTPMADKPVATPDQIAKIKAATAQGAQNAEIAKWKQQVMHYGALGLGGYEQLRQMYISVKDKTDPISKEKARLAHSAITNAGRID